MFAVISHLQSLLVLQFETIPQQILIFITNNMLVELGCILSIIVVICVYKSAQVFYLKHTLSTLLEITFPANTAKSAFATEQLFKQIHTLGTQKSFIDHVLLIKKAYVFEIVATKNEGIRYMIQIPTKEKDSIKRNLLTYVPGITIRETSEYYSFKKKHEKIGFVKILDLTFSHHFALPLLRNTMLTEHDVISALTGNMTNLLDKEIIAYQLVITPVISPNHRKIIHEMNMLKQYIYQEKPLSPFFSQKQTYLSSSFAGNLFSFLAKMLIFILMNCIHAFLYTITLLIRSETTETTHILSSYQATKQDSVKNPYEQELRSTVKAKIDQHTFETSIRLLVKSPSRDAIASRLSGLLSAFGPLNRQQGLVRKKSFLFPSLVYKKRLNQFVNRVLSKTYGYYQNPILSTSELADLYHFPFGNDAQTEDLNKQISPSLPLPLTLKNRNNVDVIVGKNSYTDPHQTIGLTEDERTRHMYLIGQTGSGKSTVIFAMANDDMQKGKGLCVIDPHGDLVEELLKIVPRERINDVVYINPYDIHYPIAINLLELSEGLQDDELALEKELVCENVISIFRRIFLTDDTVNAHRIEYLLRNTIYTAFYIKGATIFTVYKLLTNPDYRRKTMHLIDDEHLQDFWKYEFGKAGNWQIFKMVSGVTAKLGRFLFSPIASRMLEKSQSTVNFEELLNQNKIILCNLAEGKLGEDTSQLIGTTIITKIHQAVLKRSRIESQMRTPFYLYVDEFQNFATSYFTKLLSGGRKFGLRITIAQQSTAQQHDKNITNVILANVGTVVCFKTASPVDEELMLPQFYPYVKKGQILNLARHHFYIKLGYRNPLDAFSGITLPLSNTADTLIRSSVIAASQKNYAKEYIKTEETFIKIQKKQKEISQTNDQAF